MKKFAEASVGSMGKAALFWVIKNTETGKYLTDDNDWTDTFEDAQVFDEETLDEKLDNLVKDYDLSSFGQEALDKHIAYEKKFWEDEYDSQPKDKYNLIDDWNLRYDVREKFKAVPIYAEKFHEATGADKPMKKFLVACGPGIITTWQTGDNTGTNDYSDYVYMQGVADMIQEAIIDDLKGQGGLDSLSQYCDINGITKITFKRVKNIDNRYYLEWEVEAEDSISESDIEKFKDWFEGQMSDGWGEGFEQRPFNSYEDTTDYEYEEEGDEEDEGGFYTDYETVKCEDFYSPWTSPADRAGKDYNVLVEEIDSVQESKEPETNKLTEQARIKWMVKVSHGQRYSSSYEFATKHEAEDKFNELVNEPGTDTVELCKVSSDPELIPTGIHRMTFKRRGGIDYYMAVKTQKQQPAEDLKFEDLEISNTADDFADAYIESTSLHGTVIRESGKWRFNPDKLAKESIQKVSAPLNEELDIKALKVESAPKKTDELKKWLKESGEYDWEEEEEDPEKKLTEDYDWLARGRAYKEIYKKLIGSKIMITDMEGEPQYTGKTGVVGGRRKKK